MNENVFLQLLKYVDDFFPDTFSSLELPATEDTFRSLLALDRRTIQVDIDQSTGDLFGWMISLPTTSILMGQFLAEEISEKELFEQTCAIAQLGKYQLESVYLCSAFVLPEYRGQGVGRALVHAAINAYRVENEEVQLFNWPANCMGRIAVARILDQSEISFRTRAVSAE